MSRESSAERPLFVSSSLFRKGRQIGRRMPCFNRHWTQVAASGSPPLTHDLRPRRAETTTPCGSFFLSLFDGAYRRLAAPKEIRLRGDVASFDSLAFSRSAVSLPVVSVDFARLPNRRRNERVIDVPDESRTSSEAAGFVASTAGNRGRASLDVDVGTGGTVVTTAFTGADSSLRTGKIS